MMVDQGEERPETHSSKLGVQRRAHRSKESQQIMTSIKQLEWRISQMYSDHPL